MYKTPEAAKSMEHLASLGTNWTALAFAVFQEKFSSTHFGFDYKYTVTDREIETAVNKFHSLGVKVCLKPILNCMDGNWRAYISFPEPTFGHNKYWDEWFDCYTAFMCHYAEIAEETGCEMLCIGCEMIGTEHKEDYWRRLIEKVRVIYHGPIVYNANHGKEENVKWWDAVDYIGTSAYYPVAKHAGASEAEMMEGWEKAKGFLSALSEKHGKKIIFMEIGCRSAAGCATMPWDFSHKEYPYSEEEQANFYSSCFKVISGEDWFMGYFWWDWYTNLFDKEQEMGFSIYGKKAEKVVKEWYGR